MPIFGRRNNPPVYSDYRAYKPLLREDFRNLCAYCLLHEGDELGGGYQHFQIDHFRPVKSFPLLSAAYGNLYYSCRWCNNAKSDTWPSDEQARSGYQFVDPCVEDFYKDHAAVDRTTGKLTSLTKAGHYTIREVRLNRAVFSTLRRRRIQVQQQIDAIAIRLSELKKERSPRHELIAALEENMLLLAERFINPKIPYEATDLLVEE